MKKNLNLRLFALLLLSMLAISYFAVNRVQAQALIWAKMINPTVYDDVAYDVAVGTSGLYIVGGSGWRVQKRSLLTGSLIWTKISSGDKGAHGVALDGSGLYVVGSSGNKWLMEKRGFLTGGLIWSVTNSPSATGDTSPSAEAVAVDRTGLYVVGCDCTGYSGIRWRMEKHSLLTGRLIWTRISDPSIDDDFVCDVAVDSTGLYVVGDYRVYDSVTDDYVPRSRVEKRSLLTGSLIWTKTGVRFSQARGVAVDGSGLYVVGEGPYGGGSWLIEKRSLMTGSLIWTRTSNPSSGGDVALGVAAAGQALYVVGYDEVLPGTEETYNTRWRIEKRSTITGALIWIRTSNYDRIGDDAANAVAVDRTGIYVVGYGCTRTRPTEDDNWQIEKRGL